MSLDFSLAQQQVAGAGLKVILKDDSMTWREHPMDLNALVGAINRAEEEFERAMLANTRPRNARPTTNPVAWADDRTHKASTAEGSIVSHIDGQNSMDAHGAG